MLSSLLRLPSQPALGLLSSLLRLHSQPALGLLSSLLRLHSQPALGRLSSLLWLFSLKTNECVCGLPLGLLSSLPLGLLSASFGFHLGLLSSLPLGLLSSLPLGCLSACSPAYLSAASRPALQPTSRLPLGCLLACSPASLLDCSQAPLGQIRGFLVSLCHVPAREVALQFLQKKSRVATPRLPKDREGVKNLCLSDRACYPAAASCLEPWQQLERGRLISTE